MPNDEEAKQYRIMGIVLELKIALANQFQLISGHVRMKSKMYRQNHGLKFIDTGTMDLLLIRFHKGSEQKVL